MIVTPLRRCLFAQFPQIVSTPKKVENDALQVPSGFMQASQSSAICSVSELQKAVAMKTGLAIDLRNAPGGSQQP